MYETTDYAVMVNAIGSIFEFSWYLRGFMRFYEDLKIHPEMVEAQLDAMLEFQSAMFDEILSRVGSYISVVMTGSDLGTQRAPAMAEKTYLESGLAALRQVLATHPQQNGRQNLLSFVR